MGMSCEKMCVFLPPLISLVTFCAPPGIVVIVQTPKSQARVNTLDDAIETARQIAVQLNDKESPAHFHYRIFSSLSHNKLEGLLAYLIWSTRGQVHNDDRQMPVAWH